MWGPVATVMPKARVMDNTPDQTQAGRAGVGGEEV